MSADRKMDAGIAFAEICTERHVPTDVWAQIALNLPKNVNAAERHDYFIREIERIKRDWPFIPMEDYLAQIEETKNWNDLRRYACVYWQDVPSMLADAVRTRSVETVRQLALHCLFRDPLLKEEMLALAPDQRTRKALLCPPRVKAEEIYRQYPLCIAENRCMNIHGRFLPRERNVRVINLPDDIQERLFERFKIIKGFQTNEQLFKAILDEKNEGDWRVYPQLNNRLFRMGYQTAGGDVVRVSMPECWLTHETMKDIQFSQDEIVETGILGLVHEADYLGWTLKFDGVNNCFGYTGYTYLTQWP